jgi:pimeloyl-ACP methyl ester carboxylesterase
MQRVTGACGSTTARGSRNAPRTILVAAVVAVACAVAGTPAAAQGDPTLYCTAEGGPLGALTDLEHSVLLGEAPLPAGLRSRQVSVEGVSTRVIEGGSPDAEHAVVFVHGNPGSARDFDDLVAAGGEFTRTVAFDISGYGESDHFATHVQSTEGAARFIGGVLDELGIRRAVLAAHDFGGVWGLNWAVEHPSRLTAAVLINAGVLIDYVPHPFAVVWSNPGAGEAHMASTTREGFNRTLQSANPRGLPRDYVDRMYDGYDRATRCAALRYYRSAIRLENADMGRRQAAALREDPRPALVIWGDKDIFIPSKHAQDQREAFPDAQIHVLEDSGHWPFVDNAERTRELFVSFLRPTLAVLRPRAGRGGRRLRVPVRADGVVPAQDVRARTGRRASRSVGEVSGRRVLRLRLRRPLRPGRHVVAVSARGLPEQRVTFRVQRRAAAGRR